MKKYLFVIGLSCLLVLTGCGKKEEKRLVCTQKVSSSGVEVNVDMLADFKGDNLDYLGLKYTMDLSEYNDVQIDAIAKQDMCSVVKTSMTASGLGEAFTNCKQGVNNKVLEITADFDLDKMVGDDLSRKTSVEEATKELEKQGYTCKVQ